jgi:hypothetical protein
MSELLIFLMGLGWAPCERIPPPGSCVALVDSASREVWQGDLVKHWPNGFSLIDSRTQAGAAILIGTVDPGLLCPVESDK